MSLKERNAERLSETKRRLFFVLVSSKGSSVLLGQGTDENQCFCGPSVGGWTTGRMAAGTNDEAGEQTQFFYEAVYEE